MNWYLVKMVFQIICGNGNHKPQFDEQLRLIAAVSKNEAIEKANCFSKLEQQPVSELVQWKLIAITDVYPFTNLIDGAELFSTITETDHATLYIHTAQLKEKNCIAQEPLFFE
jgi:hypothetical protein